MTCPYCPNEVGPRDGVYVTWRHGNRIVAHSACHARATSKLKDIPASCVCWSDPNWQCMVPVCSSFDPGRDGLCEGCDHAVGCHGAGGGMAETLVALISRMLEVEPMDQTPEQWRESRARNVAQRLLNDFEIKERK